VDDPGRAELVVRLSAEARDLLARLAEKEGLPPSAYVEQLLRAAARRSGLGEAEAASPAIVLEETEELPAIGPEGRGRRIRLKGIDETGEWDAGEIFVPDPKKE